jgi:tripartite-type tricarboxylate transporter receptor subunit TctC
MRRRSPAPALSNPEIATSITAMTPPALLVSAALSAVFALAATMPATAQGWPNRPISMIATFPAGGPTDGVARVLAHELGERLKQKVVVENRGGAGGTLGAAAVAKSSPDGHTLLLTSTGPLGYYRALYKSLPYDPVKDFAPAALIGTIPQVIIVSPKLKAATLREFIEHARANPGRVNIGDSGVGTTLHILAAQMALVTGIEIQHVHYRGAAGSVADVMGGQIEAALSGFVPTYVTMKVLGVTWTDRLKALPNVPTFRESGLDIVSGLSLTLVAPAGTPPDVIARLNAATNDFLKSERGKSFETNYSLQIAAGTPEAAREFLANDAARLEPVIRKAKIAAD